MENTSAFYPLDTKLKNHKSGSWTAEVVKQITAITIEPGVEVEVTVADQ